MTLTVLKGTGQILHRLILYSNFSIDCFFKIRLGLSVLKRKSTEIECHCHHVMSCLQTTNMAYTTDMNLTTRLKYVQQASLLPNNSVRHTVIGEGPSFWTHHCWRAWHCLGTRKRAPHLFEHREYTVSGGVGEAPKQNHSALMMRKGENGTRRLPEMSSMSTYR